MKALIVSIISGLLCALGFHGPVNYCGVCPFCRRSPKRWVAS